jgi:hypothetical protein
MARSTPPKKRPATASHPPETDDLDLAWTDDAFFGKAKPAPSPKPTAPAAAPAPPPVVVEPALPLDAEQAPPFAAEPAPPLAAEPDWSEDEFFGTTKKVQPEAVTAPPGEPAAGQAEVAKHAATLAFGTAAGDALELVSVRAASAPPGAPSSTSLDEIRSRFEVGDCSGALLLAEAILETEPENAEALRYAERCQEVLQKMYVSRLGGLNRVPQVTTSAEQMRWLSLDHRAGFVLSLIDGTCTFDEILDISGMRRLDALRILFDLFQQNVIAVA